MKKHTNFAKYPTLGDSGLAKILFLFLLIIGLSLSFQLKAQIAPINVPSGGFHIDGNLLSNNPVNGVGDWVSGAGTGGFVINNDGSLINSLNTRLVIDKFNDNTDEIFQASKFNDNPNLWSWSVGKATSKNDINNVALHLGEDNLDNTWLIVAGDRLSTNGTSYIDFEFLQNTLTKEPSGIFSSAGPHGGRTINDMVLSMEYSNGGSVATVRFYLWKSVGTGYAYVEQTISPSTAFAVTNANTETITFGAFGLTNYSPFQFVEAAVNITELFGAVDPCLGINVKTVMVKTKASASETASLGDFVEPMQVSFNFGTAEISYNSLLCNTGIAEVSLSGVEGGTFSSSNSDLIIDPVTGAIDLENSVPGNYEISYSFITNGCEKIVCTNITVSSGPVAPISITTDQAHICPDFVGNINLSAIGGSGENVVWFAESCNSTPIATGTEISITAPTSTTTYFAQWQNQCGVSSCAEITITVSEPIIINISADAQVSCPNIKDGSINVSITGGTGSFSYSINGAPVQTSPNFENLSPGNYTITVYDEFGCSYISSPATIANPDQITASVSASSQVSCNNATDGELVVTANGGTGV
ncbi:MAG: SprB repeat-containing protein, partial [Bacteroidales bacterium]|nr:SprB repeat-containing protein [Bacteroidales bacterium]